MLFKSKKYKDIIEEIDNVLNNIKITKADLERKIKVNISNSLYIFDDSIEQDYALGVQWLKKAAQNQHVEAMVALAKCYEEGYGVLKNVNDAIFWYRKASLMGNEEATERLNELEEY